MSCRMTSKYKLVFLGVRFFASWCCVFLPYKSFCSSVFKPFSLSFSPSLFDGERERHNADFEMFVVVNTHARTRINNTLQQDQSVEKRPSSRVSYIP